jgi:hypothetical protein
VLFTGYLAFGALENSSLTAAAAAQGDLGFYMVLRVTTPVVLLLIAAAFAAGVFARRTDRLSSALVSPVALLAYISVLGVAWNWVYLYYFWR